MAEPPNAVSPFLELPAELRNRIYRYSVLSDHSQAVTNTGINEPALLQVNKQVRREAITIYYHENDFRIHVLDFNSDVLMDWRSKCSALEKQYKIAHVQISVSARTPNWENLKVWLKRFHARQLIIGCRAFFEGDVFPPEDRSKLEIHVIATIFSMVEAFQGIRRWAEVETLVERMHIVLVGLNVAWK